MFRPKISVMYINKRNELHVSFTAKHIPDDYYNKDKFVEFVTLSGDVIVIGRVVRKTKRGVNLTAWKIYEP